MTDNLGDRLRERRDALGLDLDQVSEGTGVSREYLEALECGDHQRIPPGPYVSAYSRTYRLYLKRMTGQGAEAETTHNGTTLSGLHGEPSTWGSTSVPKTPVRDGEVRGDSVIRRRPMPELSAPKPLVVPLARVRGIAVVAGLAFVVALGVNVYRASEAATTRAQIASAAAPAVRVKVRVQLMRNARLAVWVDGTLREERMFGGSEMLSFAGHDRVEIKVPGVETVRVWFDDRVVSPLGQKGRPRTLIFLAADEENG